MTTTLVEVTDRDGDVLAVTTCVDGDGRVVEARSVDEDGYTLSFVHVRIEQSKLAMVASAIDPEVASLRDQLEMAHRARDESNTRAEQAEWKFRQLENMRPGAISGEYDPITSRDAESNDVDARRIIAEIVKACGGICHVLGDPAVAAMVNRMLACARENSVIAEA